MKKDDAYYIYEIKKVEENQNSSRVLDIYYGSDIKNPLHILVGDAINFIKAVIPKEQLLGITDDMLKKEIFEKGVEIVDKLLRGRTMIFISGYRDYNEYNMPTDYFIKKITCMNIDGKLEKNNGFEYANYIACFGDIITHYCTIKNSK